MEARIVEFLRDQRHDVLYMIENAPSTPDPEVLNLANHEQRLLLTNDKDFGELTFLLGKVSSGIVLVRTRSESVQFKISRVAHVLKRHGDALVGSFTVITDNRVRIRPLRRSP